MREIEANKKAWGLLAKNHYDYYKELLSQRSSVLNSIVEKELGDVSGKSIIHLHCNTGADTISLARKGALVTGSDLAPENIFYARKLADELKIKNIDFIESDTTVLNRTHNKKYDMVFASEGILHCFPNLNKLAESIQHVLKDQGTLFLYDYHPFYFAIDEDKLKYNKLEIRYPYFNKEPEYCEHIGGYASESKKADNYWWMYTISDIINPLVKAGLSIESFKEFDRIGWDLGNMVKDEGGNYYYPFFDKKIPFMFCLKARLQH